MDRQVCQPAATAPVSRTEDNKLQEQHPPLTVIDTTAKVPAPPLSDNGQEQEQEQQQQEQQSLLSQVLLWCQTMVAAVHNLIEALAPVFEEAGDNPTTAATRGFFIIACIIYASQGKC